MRPFERCPQNYGMTERNEFAPQVHARTPKTDELLRRVGRNLVVFQQIEYLLKHLTTHSAVAGPIHRIPEIIQARAAVAGRKTMGTLAGDLLENVLGAPPDAQPPAEIDQPWACLGSSIDSNAEWVDNLDRELRALVYARNELIHHFLPRWESAIDGDADDSLAYLDAQWDEAKRMLERLYLWTRSMDIVRMQAAEFWASPEAEQQIELAFLRSSPLAVMLGEIAMQTAREDGWTLLSAAGQSIKQSAPLELQKLRARFGHANLKGVLLATGVFDVVDEPTPGGGTRTIYRINERYELRSL